MNSSNFKGVVDPTLASLKRKYAAGGKVEKVMHEYKQGSLRSGSKRGPVVKNRRQAIAIALSEKRKFGMAKGGSWWNQLQDEIAAMSPPNGPMTGGLK